MVDESRARLCSECARPLASGMYDGEGADAEP